MPLAPPSSREQFLENLFFTLDVDGGGTITFDEVSREASWSLLARANDCKTGLT